jgi:hypothetical protein
MAPMSRGKNIFLLSVFIISFAVSCQKQETNGQVVSVNNIEYATAADIINLKDWLNSKKSILTVKDQARLDSLVEALNWEKTVTTNANNETLFIIPVNNLVTDKNETSFNLVIHKNVEDGIRFSTLYRIKNKQLQRINNIDLLANFISNKKNNYTCDIAAFTPTNFISYEYKLVNGQMQTRSKVSKRNPVTGSTGRTNECIYWFWITYYNDGSWDWEYLGGYCDGGDPTCNETRIMNSRSQKVNCGGGSGGFATEEQLIATFLSRIENLLQHQCLSDVLNLLKALNNGKIAQIIQQFSGEIPNWNWKLQEGVINNANLAETQHPPVSGTVTTIFDYNKLNNATELSLARTMMHESIHAYLISYFKNDQLAANKEYPELLKDWRNDKYQQNLSTVQHIEMTRSFVEEIAASLKEFGLSRGYNLSNEFYNDMAWGGLTETEAFEALGQTEKDRIHERLEAELTSQTVGNETPSNSKACN